VLYQDTALEPGFSHMLTFTLYYQNAPEIFVPQTRRQRDGLSAV
jgi:hypothetical protein